jgi:hypothetical protein
MLCVHMYIVVSIFSSRIWWQHARLQTRLGLRLQNPDTILLSLKLESLQPTFWFNSDNTLQRDEIFSLVLFLIWRKLWFKSWTHVKQLWSLKPLMLIAKPTLVQSKTCKICCHSCVANSSFQWHTLNLQEPNQSRIPCNQVRQEWWFSVYIFHVTSELPP